MRAVADGATSALKLMLVHVAWSAICAFHLLLVLVTDSDWRFLVWVGSNVPLQKDGYFGSPGPTAAGFAH